MSYLGSKAASGVFQAIIALMPPHDTYVELFAGSGQVLQRKPAAAQSYAVDLDPDALALIPEMDGLTKIEGDAMATLDAFDYAGSGRTLFYVDPPYVHSTRSKSHRYKFEMTDADHVALIQRLMLCPAHVILSGYPSQLYDSMCDRWNSREFQAMTRGGVRTEKVWFNFEPTAVHWATFAGADYIDRQRIKRKAANWAKMYATMPAGERLAILAGILSVDPAQSFSSVRPAVQSRLTMRSAQLPESVSAGRCSCPKLWSTPLPDSGVTKPLPAAGGTTGQASPCS